MATIGKSAQKKMGAAVDKYASAQKKTASKTPTKAMGKMKQRKR